MKGGNLSSGSQASKCQASGDGWKGMSQELLSQHNPELPVVTAIDPNDFGWDFW